MLSNRTDNAEITGGAAVDAKSTNADTNLAMIFPKSSNESPSPPLLILFVTSLIPSDMFCDASVNGLDTLVSIFLPNVSKALFRSLYLTLFILSSVSAVLLASPETFISAFTPVSPRSSNIVPNIV